MKCYKKQRVSSYFSLTMEVKGRIRLSLRKHWNSDWGICSCPVLLQNKGLKLPSTFQMEI